MIFSFPARCVASVREEARATSAIAAMTNASVPGCVSQGKTKEEAIANIREAIAAYIAAL